MTANRLLAACAIALLTLGASAATRAQTAVLAPPANVVALSASANLEVTKDWLTIAFSTSREGTDAATVQSQLKQALDAALTEARKGAKPGQLEVQTGNFSIYPRYTPKGTTSGWTGNAELIVEGRDIQGISQLTSRIQTMGIARVSFSLSREAREKVEGEVTGQAITRYRAKAEQVAKQFGFAGYTLREVQVSSADAPPIAYAPMRAQAMRAPGDESLPVEAGKANVTITVAGSVQLTIR